MADTSILGVFTTGPIRSTEYDGRQAEIIGDHPHKGRTATCVGISKKLFGDMYVFEYNIPWVGSKQFCVQSLTDVKWLT